MQWALSFIHGAWQEFTLTGNSPEELQDRPVLTCVEFIASLESDVQQFVLAAVLCNELLRPLYRRLLQDRLRSEAAAVADDTLPSQTDDLQSRVLPSLLYETHVRIREELRKVVAAIEMYPEVFCKTIDAAATAYLHRAVTGHGSTASPHIALPDTPSQEEKQDRIALQRVFQEWKLEFDDLEDSLKAGQMELVRLLEQNSRPAVAYEPDIAERIGMTLYSRLDGTTRRALQVAEYLYHINQEHDGFCGAVINLQLAYENELFLRIIKPFVDALQTAGTDSYDGQGTSKEPLVIGGKVPPRSITLGNAAWYLRKDPVMRSKVSTLGFDVDRIGKDAVWISSVRNNVAHEFACDRPTADGLRRRILCRDGVLSRLHPAVAKAAILA